MVSTSGSASNEVSTLLSQLPSTVSSILTALKATDKLSAALQTFLDSERSQSDGESLESAVRPILLDAGLGKKGTKDTVEKWRGLKKGQGEKEKEVAVVVVKENEKEVEVKKQEKPNDDASSGRATAAKKEPKVPLRERKAERKAREAALAAKASGSDSTSTSSKAPKNLAMWSSEEAGTSVIRPLIKATSIESRFWLERIETASKEIDLQTVNLSIGELQLLNDAHLRIKEGVKYGLVGANGSGKSTLLRALADGLIPGLPSNLKILLVSQLESESLVGKIRVEEGQAPSVMDVMLKSDAKRYAAESEAAMLEKAVEAQDVDMAMEAVHSVEIHRSELALVDARSLATKRSGAAGKEARTALIAAEKAHVELMGKELKPSERDWLGRAIELQNEALATLEDLEASTAHSRAMTILKGLGFSEAQIEGPFSALSGGWRSRLSLATALLQSTNILLLDEPSNYTDLPSLMWLTSFIRSMGNTVITVAHDVVFLNDVTEELIVLRNSQLTYFDGNLSEYERTKMKEQRHKMRQQAKLDKKREHIEKSIAEGARQAKKTGDENRQRMIKSRQKKLEDRWGIEKSAAGHRFKLNRDLVGFHLVHRAEITFESADSAIRFSFPDPEPLRFPGALVNLDDVCFSHPGAKGGKLTIHHANLNIEPGSRTALVGENGHGKTTLVKLVMRQLQPTSGAVTHHARLRASVYDQHAVSSLSQTLETPLQHFLDYVAQPGNGPEATEGEARNFLGQMGIRGRTADSTETRKLSGGQRVRLKLAEIMWKAPDLVVLDEVTTHLDSGTIAALIVALRSFKGAVLLISHDRHAVQGIVQGKTGGTAKADGGDYSDDSSADQSGEEDEEEEEEEEGREPGRVYLVESGRLQLLEKGVEEYTARLEKKFDL